MSETHSYTSDGCVFSDDAVNAFVQKAREADGFVFGTPVYYAHASGRILSFLDRAFYSSKDAFVHKPAAAVASARRPGTTAAGIHNHHHIEVTLYDGLRNIQNINAVLRKIGTYPCNNAEILVWREAAPNGE